MVIYRLWEEYKLFTCGIYSNILVCDLKVLTLLFIEIMVFWHTLPRSVVGTGVWKIMHLPIV